jgi:hypothetical protein
MEQIDIGIMLPGATVFNDQNVNPTWKAHVKTHDSTIIAFVKKVSLRDIYVECVCAIIGRYLGLPIPKPIIVKVTHDVFEGIPKGESALAFGSEDAGYPSFRRHARNEDAFEKLKSFSKVIDIGVFDEWIANWDRNLGNILYDGGSDFSFIDHENAIDPNLDHGLPAKDNQIVKAIHSVKSEFDKYRLSRDVELDLIPQYKELSLSLLSAKTYASSYLPDDEITQVISFLENRTECLKSLLDKRLGIKQQELAL